MTLDVMRSSRSGRQNVKGAERKARIQADTTKALRGVCHSAGQGKRLLDPSRELEVLKCITLREGYLERLKHLAEAFERQVGRSRGQVQVLPPGMIDLLEFLRLATLDTVEAISFWRLSQVIPTTAPFEWNGRNYLLKIMHDCDFLDHVRALSRWLGFSTTRNPFFFPGDGMNKVLAKSWNFSEDEGHCALHFRENNCGFDVGIEPWLEPLELTARGDGNQSITKANSRSRKQRNLRGRSHLTPYATPVINEPSLVPRGNACSPAQEAIPPLPSCLESEEDQSIGSPTKAILDVGRAVPNLVSKEDRERIKVAEQVIIEEESRALATAALDVDRRNLSDTSEIDPSTRWKKNKFLPSLELRKELRGNDVSRSLSNRNNHSPRELPTLNDMNPPGFPEQSSHDLQPFLTAAAGLVNQAPPEPHPGLGPIVLRSDFPNGELHPRPFVHTVGDQRARYFSNRESTLRLGTTNVPESTGGQSSKPALLLEENKGAARVRRVRNFPRRSSANRQADTAPARLTDFSSLRKPRRLDGGEHSYRGSCGGTIAPSSGRISPSRVTSPAAYQKAGAELTMLTAAGTTGRRQPPFRESRLRRLARDVSRHSNELRELLKTEQRLRRALACRGRRDFDGSVLKAKQREIEWKTFDLEGKQDELRCLRMVQHQEQDSIEALEMKQKRRRLVEGKVRPRPKETAVTLVEIETLPEDETVVKTLEENSALVVQKRFRGNKGRAFASLYEININQAATTIQRMVKFIWDRRNTRRKLLQHASAKSIQAAIRMLVARERYFHLLRQRRELLACRKLQRVRRGMHGRRRAVARRKMIAAAEKALDWVSLDSLQPKHLQELADIIRGALVDPLHQFPPAGVLGTIRVALTILDDADAETEMVTFETALGRIVRGPVSGPDLTWQMAARVLGRPYRLLRRMRAFASGLGAPSDPTPTRILRLSPKAIELLDAYRGDPSWSDDALRSTREGSIASLALVGWARELEKVYREQPYVHDFLRDTQPGWLRKSRSFQRHRRELELVAESCRSALDVAKEYREHLKSSGYAYGDPLMAFEVLDQRRKDADTAVKDLESKRVAFFASQTAAEVTAGRSLKERVEFAERETFVAARAEAVALRLGQRRPEDLAEFARKKKDWEVALREMRRQLRVWERRSKEENSLLLQEWVPPSEGQVRMARALGIVRGWEEITVIQKARVVEEAGGCRFIKGLTGDDMECWRRVCEGLEACREDIASGEARLAKDVCRYEHLLAIANEKLAAEKVLGAKWDNTGRETKELERQEDLDAARDERRAATGSIMPPGMFGTDIGQKSLRSSPRPTLLLLGHGLPAAARARIKDGLERNTPDLFGLQLAGEESLPSLAEKRQLRDVGFLDPCREQDRPPEIGARRRGAPCGGAPYNPRGRNRELDRSRDLCTDGSTGERTGEQQTTETTRASLIQATLSAGKSASFDVTAGPGLWVRGHFLRDLESLLEGLKDCGGCGEPSGSVDRGGGPTVILVDGHDRNRSGGGEDVRHGTRGLVASASFPAASNKPSGASVLPRTPVASAGRRAKLLLEEAAQCLQDLSVVQGATTIPLQALPVDPRPPTLSVEAPIEDYPRNDHCREARGPTESSVWSMGDKASIARSRADGDRGLDVLMAACFIMLHPNHRYDVGEDDEIRVRLGSRQRNTSQGVLREETTHSPLGDSTSISNVSYLAENCRRELKQCRSAQGLTEVLREVDPVSIPVDTAVALRHLSRNHAWPEPSHRPTFSGCSASAVFTAWIVAATSAVVELVLGQGGDVRRTSSRLENIQSSATHSIDNTQQSRHLGRKLDTHGMVARKGSMADRSGGSVSRPLDTLAPKEREKESEFLEGLEESLIDEIITVVDEDFPCALEEDRERQRGRYCRPSEIFVAIMNIVLKPFRVYEESDRLISLEARSNSLGSSQTMNPRGTMTAKFRVTVSRAFDSIYVFVEPSASGSKSRRRMAMARASDQELMLLLSANWMEKYDLSALRDLRNEEAVWRALVDTLVFYYPPNEGTSTMSMTSATVEQKVVDDVRAALISTDERQRSRVAPHGPAGDVLAAEGSTEYGFCAGSLHFRHGRRLALETYCRLLGHKVPVAVFEESRGDFWCEAHVMHGLASDRRADITVGRRFPKECIPWLLEENHAMHMQTVLDASDFRELSDLIADRLKLYRVKSAKVRQGTGRDWLATALSSSGDSSNAEVAGRVGAMGDSGQRAQSEDEFRFSLRKRGVGQVVFSRLVSFCVVGIEHQAGSEQNRGKIARAGVSSPHNPHVQRLVTVKEIAHRGEYGELRVEVHDPDSGGRGGPITLASELTAQLLKGWNEELVAHGQEASSIARYWRISLLWRLKLVAPGSGSPRTSSGGSKSDNRDQLVTVEDSSNSSSLCPAPDVNTVTVDSRSPLLYLRGISVRCKEPAADDSGDSHGSTSKGNATFNLVVLRQPEMDMEDDCEKREKRAKLELVATHLHTMSSYSFQIPASLFAGEVSDEVMVCLAAPVALSTETVLPKSLQLHDLAGKWLSFSQLDGCRSTLTLSFTGMEPVSTSPFVTLRAPKISGGGKSESISRKKHFPHAYALKGGDVELLMRRSSPTLQCIDQISEDVKAENVSARDPDCLRQERSQAISTLNNGKIAATLQLGTRNERMVFRRELPILALDVSETKVYEEQPPDTSAAAVAGEKPRGVIRVVLVVSVYEVFPTGLDGRVERRLRFCVRDENIRPAVEALAVVPWAGTCEGLKGGELWRVVTKGLKIRRVRDEKGGYIGMHLDVMIHGENATRLWKHELDELDGVSRVDVREEVGQDAARDVHEDYRNDGRRGISEKWAPDESGESPSLQRYQSLTIHGKQLGVRASELENAVKTNARVRGELESPLCVCHSFEESVPMQNRRDAHRSATMRDDMEREATVATKTSSTHKDKTRSSSAELSSYPNMVRDSQSDAQDFEETEIHMEEGEGSRRRTMPLGTKIYDEWLSITGVRLHVLCFQEENSALKAMSFKTNSTDIDGTHSADCSNSRYPVDRSGKSVSLMPRSSYLRFIACDPVTGRRTRTGVSVDEFYANSSAVGGVVEADLLLAGRRPALAKTLACKLRLSFEVGGGYALILPLPKEWKRAS